MRRRGLAIVALVLSPACTFGSLADYEVQTCDPSANEQNANVTAPSSAPAIPDVCDRLNDGDTSSCNPWQCDPATSQCVRRMRDDDRDGDPPAACGGGDCDDEDATLNSLRVAPPTTIGGVALASQAAPTLSYDGVNPVVAYTGQGDDGACLAIGNMESAAAGGCDADVLASGTSESSAPEEPFGLELGNDKFAAAFVATSDCPVGAVGFDFAGPPEATTVDPCGAGAALPAFAMVPNGRAVIAYYTTPPLSDALSDCAAAVSAPLTLAPVTNVGSVGEQAIGAKSVLAAGAVSIRPPAVEAQGTTVFVASPVGAAASVWALDAQSLKGPTWTVPALAGARGVSIGVRTNADGSTRVAIVGELGCAEEAIHVALVDYDPASGSFSAAGDVEVSSAGMGLQTTPSVAWSAARGRWLATWVAAGPKVVARFLDDDAKPSEGAFQVMSGAIGAVALANAHVALVATGGGSGEVLLDSAARCP